MPMSTTGSNTRLLFHLAPAKQQQLTDSTTGCRSLIIDNQIVRSSSFDRNRFASTIRSLPAPNQWWEGRRLNFIFLPNEHLFLFHFRHYFTSNYDQQTRNHHHHPCSHRPGRPIAQSFESEQVILLPKHATAQIIISCKQLSRCVR